MKLFRRDPDRQRELKHYFVYWLIMAVVFVIVLYLAYNWYTSNLIQ